MPDKKNRNFHSEEAQEIMGRAPSWVVRWGVTVIFIILALVVLGCCIIKYPEIITAPVSLTTVNAPSDLTARYDGLLDTVCVQNGETVRAGELIALLSTPADYGDIRIVETGLIQNPTPEALADAEWVRGQYSLGELQSTWAEFAARCLDFGHYLATDYIGTKRRLLQEQIAQNRRYYAQLEEQGKLLDEDLAMGRRTLERDSMLFARSVIPAADYELSVQNYLAKRNSKAGFDATLTSTQLSILQTEQQLVELSVQHDNEVAEYGRSINQLRQQLLARIAQWKEQYAVIAPVDGTVSLQGYWSKGQHVTVGTVLASIVPGGKAEVVGRMQVPTAGFGKVETGQTVNVKLNGFPYMEYGVLKGTIRSISSVPEQLPSSGGTVAVYNVEVAFPSGMETTYGKELAMIQKMDGTGEIITKDMRLIERFIQPIISLFKNR